MGRLLALGLVALALAAAETRASDVFRVAAVGDVMMGTTWPGDILPPGDGEGIFAPVAPALKGHDLVFGNLEGPLLDGGTAGKCAKGSEGRCYEFRTPRRYVRQLAEAGFRVMNVANNHAFDFGPEGVESTLEALRAAGIQPAGGETVARLTVQGRRVAVVGFSASPPSPYSHSILDLPRAREIVRELTTAGDFVVVSFHGGAEGKGALHVSDAQEVFAGERRGNVVQFARAMVDEGAALILGHGPHVPRALEVYRGKMIAYSLGNFLTYGRFNTKGPNGLGYVLQAELDLTSGDFLGGRVVSVALSEPGLPSPDPEAGAFGLLRSLTREDLGGGGLSFGAGGRLLPANAVAEKSLSDVSGVPAPEVR